MARKNKEAEGCIGIVALGVMALLALLPYLILIAAIGGSIALVVVWLMSWRRVSRLPAAPGSNAFVMLNEERLVVALAQREANRHEQELEALRLRGAHLSRRKDGSFNEVSKLAKELNPAISKSESSLANASTRAHLAGIVSDLRHLAYCTAVGQFRSWSWSFGVLVVATNVLLFLNVDFVTTARTWLTNQKAFGALTAPEFSTLILALCGGAVLAWLFNLLFSERFVDGVASGIARMPKVSDNVAYAYSDALRNSLGD